MKENEMRGNNQKMKKHNTKPNGKEFSKLTLWVFTYFAVSDAFVADVAVVYLFYFLITCHIFICILIRSLLCCIAFQCISLHSATFHCILLFRCSSVVPVLFFPKTLQKKSLLLNRNTSVPFYIWPTI